MAHQKGDMMESKEPTKDRCPIKGFAAAHAVSVAIRCPPCAYTECDACTNEIKAQAKRELMQDNKAMEGR